ncbi:hypothetical protein, partial [Enterobacter hormaechei]|uniref:hypothetical protein n=1 Tax=Enterobacter hormaechei TaxID=158836 RepID=UPI003A978BB9
LGIPGLRSAIPRVIRKSGETNQPSHRTFENEEESLRKNRALVAINNQEDYDSILSKIRR